MSTPRTVSFKGCKTNADALQRVAEFLDALYGEQERKFGADLIAANEDPEEIAWQLLQWRGVLLENRAQTLAYFKAKFEELHLGE